MRKILAILLFALSSGSFGADSFNILDFQTFNGNTWATGTGTLSIAPGKTFTASKTLTLNGTDGTTMTFPTTSATIARTDAANTFTGTQTIPLAQIGDGTVSAPSMAFSSEANTGFYRSAAGQMAMSILGTQHLLYSANGPIINAGAVNSGYRMGATVGASDVTIGRDASDTVAQRRGTNAQTYRVYNTFTDSSNYERLGITWSGNAVTIATEAAGTGSVRALNIINPTIGSSSLSLTSGAIGLSKMTASASAPGAGGAKLELVCGTNAGTAKLVISAGTSATTVTVIDNIGAGVTGC